MRLPSSTRSNLRVACILVQSFGITVLPMSKQYSVCFHNLLYLYSASAKVAVINLNLQQFVYLSEVQVQMVDISSNHCIESDPTTLVVNPIVVELGLVNRTDDVADVLIV